MDPIEAKQNHRHSLRNMREHAEDKKNGEQARRQTRNASLRLRRQESAKQLEQRRQARNDSLRSRRQQESTEQMEQWRQARNDSLRSRRQQESAEQLERRLARRESDRQRKRRQQLAQTDSHRQPLLIEFKSDLLTPLDHCAICGCVVFIDITKKVSTNTLLES